MPFGGTTSADDFESGTDRRRARRHDHHRRLRHPVRGPDAAPRAGHVDGQGRGQGGDRLRLPHDHHRAHRPGGARDGRAGRAGDHVASSCSWPTRASSCSTMRASSGRCCGRGKNGGTICMHAENGGVIDVLVEARAGRRQDRAEVSRADPAGARRGGSHAPRHRARRDRRRADLHRAPLGRRSARDGHRGARPRPAGVRGDLPAVSVPVRTTTTRSPASTAPST